MADDPSTSGSRWRDHLPWLILFRCFRPAVGARMLLLGAGGVVANVAGWRILWQLFKGSEDPAIRLLKSTSDTYGIWPAWPWTIELPNLPSALWKQVNDLAQTMVHGDATFVACTFALLCGLWTLLVWSYFGAAMSRTACLRLCRDETAPWSDVAGFSISKFPSYFSAPLFPLLGILLASIPALILGVIANIPAVGMFVAGLAFPVALLCGLFMTIIAVGFLFGWPFMWATISTEGTDAFDALSRSYAYVYQRPLHYLFYALVAAILGSLGYFVVELFVSGVPGFALWAADWGMGTEQMQQVRGSLQTLSGSVETQPDLSWGAKLIVFWVLCVKLLAVGYLVSFFWTAMSAIYLLLRRDVDATEMDEIFLTDEQQTYGLPPLAKDDAGVPGVPEGSENSGSDVE